MSENSGKDSAKYSRTLDNNQKPELGSTIFRLRIFFRFFEIPSNFCYYLLILVYFCIFLLFLLDLIHCVSKIISKVLANPQNYSSRIYRKKTARSIITKLNHTILSKSWTDKQLLIKTRNQFSNEHFEIKLQFRNRFVVESSSHKRTSDESYEIDSQERCNKTNMK